MHFVQTIQYYYFKLFCHLSWNSKMEEIKRSLSTLLGFRGTSPRSFFIILLKMIHFHLKYSKCNSPISFVFLKIQCNTIQLFKLTWSCMWFTCIPIEGVHNSGMFLAQKNRLKELTSIPSLHIQNTTQQNLNHKTLS